MKIRSGFVSNSSSSSFVVIGKGVRKRAKLHPAYTGGPTSILDIPQTLGGATTFDGCSDEMCDNFIDRLNFASLIAYLDEAHDPCCGYPQTNMLCTVLIQDMGLDIVNINWCEDSGWENEETTKGKVPFEINWGSYPSNSPSIRDIYKDEDSLRAFLYAEDSRVGITRD